MVPRSLVAVLVFIASGLLQAQGDELGQWLPLFNGKDTKGWLNAKADRGSPNRWKADEGALTIDLKPGEQGNDACTEELFENYELECEYKVPPGGNSGVYLRGWIEVQILDSFPKKAKAAKLGQGDAGAIYSAGAPLVNASKPAGEWNQFRILHLGDRITVYLNGELVQDNMHVPSSTPGSMAGSPLAREWKLDGKRGPILLQGDHGPVWYRNIRIRRRLDARDGWRPLWNGKDLSEFTARGDPRAKDGLRWSIESHAFSNGKHTGGNGHDIWTNEAFGNFLVHYEYKSGPGDANSGFYLRDQWEIQIESKNDLSSKHSDGALYSTYPVAQVARNAPDQWNHMDVKLVGNKVWVWQNGKLIHDGRELTKRTDSGAPTPAFSKAPFKLQGDHGTVAFTNLWIKPLPDTQ